MAMALQLYKFVFAQTIQVQIWKSFVFTLSTVKEGSPFSIFRRPMTAANVPSSITSASVKAKSIYTAMSTVLGTVLPV
jgi:hypothetical protein